MGGILAVKGRRYSATESRLRVRLSCPKSTSVQLSDQAAYQLAVSSDGWRRFERSSLC